MSLKRANYLCGHQSCDNKKCSVRLSRELTRAACHVLERGFRDAKRRERLLAHVTEAGEDVPDLPDLAALDLPLIEDSDTKISLASEKLDEIKDRKKKHDKKRLKDKGVQEASPESEQQVSQSSVSSSVSNRTNLVKKFVRIDKSRPQSTPRSTYGPGSNYLKFGGIDVHCKQPSSGVKATSCDANRSTVEMKMAGSSKLTDVFGVSGSLNAPKGSTARTDMFKNQITSKPIKVGNLFRNQTDEPVIIESHRRASSASSNSKGAKYYNPGGIIPESVDEMQVLFQFDCGRLTKPKFEVQDMLAEAADNKYSLLKGERTSPTVVAQNKFPSIWDASDSDDSDVPFLDKSWYLQPLPKNSRLEYPADCSVTSKNSSTALGTKREDLDMPPENSQERSNHEETCVSKDLKKESHLNAPKRMSVSFSERTPLSSMQEPRPSIGKNASEFSARQCKAKSPTQSEKVNVAADVIKHNPKTADASRTRAAYTRTPSSASTSFKSAANSTTRVVKSRTPSTTSRTAGLSTSRASDGRTASTSLSKPKFAADSTVTLIRSRTPSTTPSTAGGSGIRVAKSRSPVATSKLAATSTTSAVKRQTPSTTSRTIADSNTKLTKSRKPSTVSTTSAAVSTTKVVRRRPSSAASNSSTENREINGRTESRASTISKTRAESNAKLIQSRQALSATTKPKSAAVPTTKVVRRRPSSAASNSSTENREINGRTESRASTISKTRAESNAKLIQSRQALSASTKSKPAAVPTTKVVRRRPSSAASNSSTENREINGRTDSRASTISKTRAESNAKLIQSRQALSASTKPKSAAVPKTKIAKSRPTSATSGTSNSSTEHREMKSRTESRASTISKITVDSNAKVINSRQALSASTKPKSAAVPKTKFVKSRPTSASSNSSSTERKAISGRSESRASTISKPDSDSTNKTPQARGTSAANKSRIPLPVPAGPRPISARPLANIAPKVDCRRPMTAVVAKLSPNVKIVEDRTRPQTSGANVGSKTSLKPNLARPPSELKRKPIKLLLGSKTQCAEDERTMVSAARVSQSSDENVSSVAMKARPSLQRSALTSSSCSGWSVNAISSSHVNVSKKSILKEPGVTLVSRETNDQSGQAIKPASKIPLPVNPVHRERMMKQNDKVRDRTNVADAPDNSLDGTSRQSENKSIFNICEEMLNEEKLSPSAKAALLRMNKEMIRTGKVRPLREVRPTTAPPQGIESKLSKENIDLNEKIEKVRIPKQPSKVSVKKRISLFDNLRDSSSVSSKRTVVRNGEPNDDDYANLLELDSSQTCVGLQEKKNSFTESMMELIREDALKVAKESVVSVDDGHAKESVKRTNKNDSPG